MFFLPVKQQREVGGAQTLKKNKKLKKNNAIFGGRDFKSKRLRVFNIAAFSGR